MSKFKFHFKSDLPHQKEAIDSTLALLKGMERKESPYSIVDLRKRRMTTGKVTKGYGNGIKITNDELSFNLEEIQKGNGLLFDDNTKNNCIVPKDFTIEMETGTGKTYVYIKTALELSKKYGLKKFIIVVPSVAIREGVKKL